MNTASTIITVTKRKGNVISNKGNEINGHFFKVVAVNPYWSQPIAANISGTSKKKVTEYIENNFDFDSKVIWESGEQS